MTSRSHSNSKHPLPARHRNKYEHLLVHRKQRVVKLVVVGQTLWKNLKQTFGILLLNN